ncbi:hypothetical protein BDQ94DRAFT_145992 [Aspergillus welwitschiae]|uniref:Uncharacterized protein n=1 Tax=Aspergillus welwitschiae TaxID=1341132 RepID=A0A3F3PYD7_9EURO|nr:hypothetical protein BDQ94DRAFT_145992 [Aspergillus welwitschiae]RDH31901.1 hypothetical protein BDQ94DRAFT_145992 [Aspergillus welwitschiae]
MSSYDAQLSVAFGLDTWSGNLLERGLAENCLGPRSANQSSLLVQYYLLTQSPAKNGILLIDCYFSGARLILLSRQPIHLGQMHSSLGSDRQTPRGAHMISILLCLV